MRGQREGLGEEERATQVTVTQECLRGGRRTSSLGGLTRPTSSALDATFGATLSPIFGALSAHLRTWSVAPDDALTCDTILPSAQPASQPSSLAHRTGSHPWTRMLRTSFVD